jgi:Tol biopolymer transport system component
MSRRSIASGALAASLLVLAAPAGAGAVVLPADTTAVISGTPDLLGLLATPVSDSSSTGAAASQNGTKVAFASDADGLRADDDDTVTNVYVKDMVSGVVELVSRASDGQPSHTRCFDAAISDDGTNVAFTCFGPLDAADTNNDLDVYVRDLVDATTTLVSRASGGGSVGDGSAVAPVLDGSGSFVAFASTSNNLVAGLPPDSFVSRVYRREIGNGDAVVLVSRRDGQGGAANVASAENPSISDNGALVAFETDEPLVPVSDGNGVSDIYLRRIGDAGSTTQLVSVSDDGSAAGNGPSTGGIVSGEGAVVAFTSAATNLEADPAHDADPGEDVYVRSFGGGGSTTLVSRAGASAGNGDSKAASIDDRGKVVGFISRATDFDAADATGGPDAYVSVDGGAPQLVSQPTGTAGPAADNVLDMAVSGGGSTAVMSLASSMAGDLEAGFEVVVARDIAGESTRTVSRPLGDAPFVNDGGHSLGGSVSADGRYVAFASFASGLGAIDGAGPSIFVRDVLTGAVTLVSREDGSEGAVVSNATDPHISADGLRVAFVVSPGGQTVLAASVPQVYVRDIPTGHTFLASSADDADDVPGDARSFAPSISDDGSRVVFISRASNLGDGDTDGQLDAHVRDLATGDTLLVNRADKVDVVKGDSGVNQATISGDGQHVAFTTAAKNLGDGDDDGVLDVHVRDIDADRTRLVSAIGEQTKGDRDSFDPSISRDGERVAFISRATNFGQPSAVQRLYVRDLAERTLTLAGRGDRPDGAPLVDGIFDALLSADGSHVAFAAGLQSVLVPGDLGDGIGRAYVRDLVNGTTRLVSRRSGVDGAPEGIAAIGGITADGGCVAFDSFDPLVPLQGDDFEVVYLRAITADCGRPVPPPPDGRTPPGESTPPGGRSAPAVLSGLSVKPARFHVGGRRGGTSVSFRLDEASDVTLAFERLLTGHRKGKRCSTEVRRGKRCPVVRFAGRLPPAQSSLHAGSNTVKFSGKLGGKTLARGRYRLTATPAGGVAHSVTVTVVKAPKAKQKRSSPKRKGH